MTHNTGDSLRDLAQSTQAFYERFGAMPTADADLMGWVRNFEEEVRELIEAAHDGTNQDHIAEEAADVFVTVIGVCFARGVDVERLVQQVYKVIAKNDAKTHETHVVYDGKIRRRTPK